jgi:phospholipid-binding lipoprotein MlaA
VHRSLEHRLSVIALLGLLALLATGCGTLAEIVGPPVAPPPPPLVAETDAPEPPPTILPVTSGAADAGVPAPSPAESPGGMAQVRETPLTDEAEDYDPWEPYNERMFAFNYNVDRYVLKPTANVYRHIIPEPWQIMISNGYDNIRFPARFVNLMLQRRFWGAFLETSRFVINSVMGVGGLFNPATEYFGIPRQRADFGQTLAGWGVGAGPFFVPPLLPPATVRDFVGRLADSALNPIAWFLIDFWPEGLAIGAGEMVNERAVTYELFQGVEETTLDLYTAVRDGYLRRRERQLRQVEE